MRVSSSPRTIGSIGMPAAAYSRCIRSESAQKWGGVQTKMIVNSQIASQLTSFVTAAMPTTGGIAPAAPPITMLSEVQRFSQRV